MAAFKDNGWGARPLGMGGAFTSVADDVNAPLFNPAGTAQMEKTEITFTYSRLFTGVDLQGLNIYSNYAAFAQPTKNIGSFGFIWANQTVSSLYKENTYLLNYAHTMNRYFPNLPFEMLVGANLKYLSNSYTLDDRTIATNDPVFKYGTMGRGYAVDLGVLLNFDRNAFGFSVKNLNTPDVGLLTQDKVAREFSIGISRYYYNFGIFNEAIPTLDLYYRDEIDPDLKVRIGTEGFLWDRRIAVRFGAEHSRSLTMGFGYNTAELMNKIELQTDYAFILPLTLEETSGTHRFSLTMRFSGVEKPVAKAISPEYREAKMMELWQQYVHLVESGSSLEARERFLKKFVKNYRYSDLDVSFAVKEYNEVQHQIKNLKKLKKLDSMLQNE
jgi:hypothetical protein